MRPGELDVRLAADEDDRLEVRELEAGEALDEAAVGDQHLRRREVDRVLEVGAAG